MRRAHQQVLGIRTLASRVKTLDAADVTLRGTYWFDLRARDPFAAVLKRLLDLCLAVPLALLSLPLLLVRSIERERRVGFRGNEFDAFVFRGRRLRTLPHVLNVLAGSMSLVGPRAMLPSEAASSGSRRFSVQPGWIGPATVREGREEDLDRDYVNGWSLRRDLAILWAAAFRLEASRR